MMEHFQSVPAISSQIAFYTRMGFRQADSVVSDIGGGFVMDDYIMAKPIP